MLNRDEKRGQHYNHARSQLTRERKELNQRFKSFEIEDQEDAEPQHTIPRRAFKREKRKGDSLIVQTYL